jgi:hypothetical protein
MKRFIKNIIPVAAATLLLGMTSCTKDLDVTPIDPSKTMVPDEAALYTKCYANMALQGQTGQGGDVDIDGLDGGTAGFVRQLFNANELTTDEAICAWGDPGIPAFNFNQWDASHPMLQGFYYRLFTGIAYCNHYLEVCAGVDATREAEVRFLRALYYYHLMDCFGNVPFATKLMSTSPEQIQRADLFKWIEEELLDVKDKLMAPAVRKDTDSGYGRADQDAANLLLARLYLNAEVYTGNARWAEAQQYAEKVINGPHKLWTQGMNGFSAYQMLFMGDNGSNGASQEAILPILQDGIKTTAWCTSLFLMASTWKGDMDTESNYGTSEFWAGNRARSTLVAKFFPNNNAPALSIKDTPIAAGDDRALFYGIERELVVTTPTEFTSGYSVGKYRNTYASNASPHNSRFIDTDFFLMRSAEAYLIAAEADARQHGGTTSDTGKNYINALRQRANTSTLNSYSLNQILDERSRELYFEGFRRTDLIRYGFFGGNDSGKYLWEWKSGAQNGAALPAYRNLFAIPAEDVNANPNLKQNEGY